MPPIVFASESFLKKIVFERARLEHSVDQAVIDETPYSRLGVHERARRLALAKCQQVVGRHGDSIVIAADTVATCDGVLLQRPSDLRQAFAMALSLSGKEMVACTGVSLYDPRQGDVTTELSETRVRYQTFIRADLERLFKDRNPLRIGSALGVYTNAPGFTLVKSIDGSYTGMFGMPMEVVYDWLRRRGYLAG